MNNSLTSPIKFLNGVGPKLEVLFNKLDVVTIKDCLYFFPREYDDRRQLPTISQLANGSNSTILATIESINIKQVKKGVQVIEAVIYDTSSRMVAVWFNQAYLKTVLIPGKKIVIKGKCEENLFSKMLQMQVQTTEIIQSQTDLKDNVGVIVPVYKLTAGLYQTQVRQIVKQAIAKGKMLVAENLPQYIKQKFNLLSIEHAITELHYPNAVDSYKKAKQRIVFEEFFYYQLKLEQQRIYHQHYAKTDKLVPSGEKIKQYLDLIPYQLTTAQTRVYKEILEDLSKPIAMNRLLQGDVGSGKTDVAIIALLCAIENNKSGVIMAPTEILASQHFFKMSTLLKSLDVECCLITGKMKKKDKEKMLAIIDSQKPIILIGTHALIEKYLTLSNCGVVIIDEQHRFGVMQRIELQEKAKNPHCLFMTATPIPRSSMLTCFGDLDKSIIDELPPGRIPPKTTVISDDFLPNIYHHCHQILLKKEQIYIVFPLIEESEKIDLKSAMEGFEQIKQLFPNHTVGLVHGKLKPAEKEAVMNQFKSNNCHILVTTTVIEVGIDVPNATIMIINDADRFGLSQLHQLRGRIGRGQTPSNCFLVSKTKSEMSRQRLNAMAQTTNGFKIAEYDLSIRGPGDILGKKQSGLPNFQLGDIIQDETILLAARKMAKTLLAQDPNLTDEKHQRLKVTLQAYKNSSIGKHLN